MQNHVIKAVFRREFAAYFASPTGYVFITVFVFLCALAAFWLPGFFLRNLANLDQLNQFFPWLLLAIVPAITMSAWAEERRSGADQLLLTLPASDAEIVLGKLLARVAIYTVALAFAAAGEIGVLLYLGRPDTGLLDGAFFGQWLAGASLIAVGLAAGAVTNNLTVSFVVAALACAGVVGAGWFVSLIPGEGARRLSAAVSFTERFTPFGRGVIALENIVYFLAVGALGFLANVFLIHRLHWAGGPGSRSRTSHGAIRAAAMVIGAGALVVLVSRLGARADATQERLWSLSPETRRLLRDIPANRPVYVTAYVSPVVPSSYAQTRETLLGLLAEFAGGAGGGRVSVRVVSTEPYIQAAREAQRSFGITPQPVQPSPNDPDTAPREVFMGVAFVSGPEQSVIPFLSRGLPVEYELARALRAVSSASRKTVGVLDTDAELFGRFNFQSFTPGRDWPILDELRKQHNVERVSPDEDIRADIDALIVPQPSTLTDEQLARVIAYMRKSGPTLILEDPLPLVNPAIATLEPRDAARNPFDQTPPDTRPKADLKPLWDLLGAYIPPEHIAWDAFNPRPQMGQLPREFIFVGRGNGTDPPFNEAQPETAGLQEVVLLAPGELRSNPRLSAGDGPRIIQLLLAGAVSGHTLYHESVQRSMFGPQWPLPTRRFYQTPEPEVLAARITGPPADFDEAGALVDEMIDPAAAAQRRAAETLDVFLIPDLDLISQEFFTLRAMGAEDLEFDNVTFILNCVDTLVGDSSLVELRKRRREHRTLERLDATRRDQQRAVQAATEAANAAADEELSAANRRLQERVAEIEARPDLDANTRRIMIEQTRRAEQRRVDAASDRIQEQQRATIADARTTAVQTIARTEMRIRLAAVLLPPIPAFALGVAVFLRRRAREREGVVQERLR